MKAAVTTVLVALFASPVLAAEKTILDCRVATIISSNYFEEALSKEEYPDVSVTMVDDRNLELSMGMYSTLETKEGDMVAVRKNDRGQIVVTGHYKKIEDSYIYQITTGGPVRNRPGRFWATLKAATDKRSKFEDVALLICK